ncbi:hypothetical protein VTO42DRAFT_4918 [Malbranchea cinnamomea]
MGWFKAWSCGCCELGQTMGQPEILGCFSPRPSLPCQPHQYIKQASNKLQLQLPYLPTPSLLPTRLTLPNVLPEVEKKKGKKKKNNCPQQAPDTTVQLRYTTSFYPNSLTVKKTPEQKMASMAEQRNIRQVRDSNQDNTSKTHKQSA